MALITPCLLMLTSTQRNTVVGESRDIFTKRVLGEKDINGIMCKNPRKARLPLF